MPICSPPFGKVFKLLKSLPQFFAGQRLLGKTPAGVHFEFLPSPRRVIKRLFAHLLSLAKNYDYSVILTLIIIAHPVKFI